MVVRLAIVVLLALAGAADAAFYLKPHGGVFGPTAPDCLLISGTSTNCLLVDGMPTHVLLVR